MQILAVPLPQFVYPPIDCSLCCVPCDDAGVGVGVADNSVDYSVGEVDPYYNGNVDTFSNFPSAYGIDANAAQVDPFDQQVDPFDQQVDPFGQQVADAAEPTDNSNNQPSDTDSVPSDDGTDSGASNVLDDPREILVSSVLSQLAQTDGDTAADFTNAVNDFINRIVDPNTT